MLPGVNVVTVGTVLDMNCTYQDHDSPNRVEICLDSDQNPHNGVGDSVCTADYNATGDAVEASSRQWDTTGVVPGAECHLLAAISDGEHTRYMYAPQSLVFELPLDDSDDNYEENDTLDAAYDLSDQEGTWLHLIDGLGTQADADWYQIVVSGCRERIIIDCKFTHADGNVDVGLYDSGGSLATAAEGVADNEYIDFTVPAMGIYYIQVYGDNAGATYDLWWQTMAPEPDPPADVQASDGTYTDRIEISWTGSPCADEYRVYRHTTDDPAAAIPLGRWQQEVGFTDYSAQAETVYFYWVLARTVSGTSQFSPSATGWRETPEPIEYDADVNDSGVVDAADVQLVINDALGIATGYPTDLDDSGRVDAVDVQLVINAALGIM